MNQYSIGDLEQLSGIKAHTIRIWEKRYNALTPKRSLGNTRFYDDSDLRKLLNVVSLFESGRKISELFSMSEAQLNELLQEKIESSKSANMQFEYFISQMIIAGLNYNEVGFEKLFSACLLRSGMKSTYVNVIYPMLFRVGLIWGKDELGPAQEHFLSNLIKQKIHASIDGLSFVENEKKSWLLFLPSYESHEIGLLFSNYLIRSVGIKTVYLGSNVPFNSLKESINAIQPSNLLLFFIRNFPVEEAQDYLKELHKISYNTEIHIAGNKKLIEQLTLEKNMYWIKSVEDLEKRLLS